MVHLPFFLSILKGKMFDKEKVEKGINFSTTVIDAVIRWKRTGEYPDYMHEPAKRLVWDAHFTPFRVNNGKLWLGSKEVIPTDDPTEQRDAIADAYNSPAGLGKGLNSMTLFVQGKYIGIRRTHS